MADGGLELFIPGFGKQYFMAVEDVFSRYILAWTLSLTQTGEVVVDLLERAWEEAERLCGWVPEPVRVRTDNGGQYRSQALQDYLEAVEERSGLTTSGWPTAVPRRSPTLRAFTGS